MFGTFLQVLKPFLLQLGDGLFNCAAAYKYAEVCEMLCDIKNNLKKPLTDGIPVPLVRLAETT